jgi:outer membrane protein assembly factor BamB
MKTISKTITTFSVLVGCAFMIFGLNNCSDKGQNILEKTGIKGGLVVHIGCGDGTLTTSLLANNSYLVEGLDTSAENISKAGALIDKRGLNGKVTVKHLKGTFLPYIDNLVNLVVSEDLGSISIDEVIRVLAPNGVAYIKQNGHWLTTVKPRPEEIDEWTHYLHDATGNPVANDIQVGPPRHMQWTGGPKWCRHHDHISSLNALVSAQGRIFYIIDEGAKESIQLPPQWVLAARDAFNGIVLWKRPIPTWYNHLFPLKSGPGQLPRRLVAIGERVYVTLKINAPVSALDAASGEIIQTYPGTQTAEEIIYSQNKLLLLVNPSREPVSYAEEDASCWKERDRASYRWGWDEKPRVLMAIDPRTAKHIWKQEQKVVPMTLASDGEKVLFHDGQSLVCLSIDTGEEIWRSEPLDRLPKIPTGYLPSLRIHKDVILFSGKQRSMVAVSAENGEVLWKSELSPSGHFCPEDIFVINGLVWSGDIAYGNRAGQGRNSSGLFTGRDIYTANVKKEFPIDVETFFMHQRCYPSKATNQYLIPSWTGTEFIDVDREHWNIHHWVRGSCVYGVMPCNGLLYAPPHSCACYYQSKLYGLCALAPHNESVIQNINSEREINRLERGPAYSKTEFRSYEKSSEWDWPTYRHDASRSGFTKMQMSSRMSQNWVVTLGGKLSSMVVADGRLFVSEVDQHTVYALDAGSGNILWRYTAGGRVDSPPTAYQGCVLFGSADGYIYCLRDSDGELVWRFRAAPGNMRHVAYGQVESVWPVHGNVLIQNDQLYSIAGRSMFLDGGMRLLRLDPKTGNKISETVLDDCDPETGQNLQTLINVKKMPVALPDILSSDGKYVYMRSQRFNLDGRRSKIAPEHQTDQDGEGAHLFSPIGFLDDTWFHRGYWIYGKNAGEGWGEWFIPGRLVPSGRILVFNEENVYGYGRDPVYLCNSSVLEYRLFAADKGFDPALAENVKRAPEDNVNWKNRTLLLPRERNAVKYQWLKEQPSLLVQAMTLSDKVLFIAGPPDVVDEREAWGSFLEPDMRVKLDQQLDALKGNQGGLLQVVSTENGENLAEYKLHSPPIFDGMIAANKNLYLALKNGDVVCFSSEM